MLAGIDVGSTGLKVALYQEEGQRLGYAYREYAIEYGRNGQAVLNPDIWWRSLQSCLQELSNSLKLYEVEAIAISSANAMILTTEDMSPLFPAIMQLDKRGAQMVEKISRELGDDFLFSKTGNRNAPGYQWGSTLKWLQIQEPELFSQVRRIYNPTSYLTAKLTGSYNMDVTRAATTLLLDTEKKCWDRELWEYFGLSSAKQPELLTCCQVAGKTREGNGFPAGIPVAAGGIDTVCAMLGLKGKAEQDVLIMGSVGRFAVSVKQWGRPFLNTISWDGTQKISMTPVNNAGTALKWIRGILHKNYSSLNQMAEQILPGSEGLIFLPYLNGASCPRWEETVRGTFLGAESYHTAGHFARAVMEGVAFSLGESQQLLIHQGCDTSLPLYMGGGGAKSSVWCQILSDVLGRELWIPKYTETETMGAAILGGLAAGKLCKEQLKGWNEIQHKVYPIKANQEYYLKMQLFFSEIYEPLRQIYSSKSVPRSIS